MTTHHGGPREDHPSTGRLVRLPFLAAVRFYQLCISPLLPPSCRFFPSCSAYTFTAIERFGPVTGIWLGARRLLRCHPWNPGGVDHVPQRGEDGRPMRKNDRDPGGDGHPTADPSTRRPTGQ